MTSIYLDTCALNRLTDDQTQFRIREEAQAVTRILSLVSSGELRWVGSYLLLAELRANPNEGKRQTSLAFASLASVLLKTSPEADQRASELERQGYGPFDALHLALSETAAVNWFLTVDDRFLKRAATRPGSVTPPVTNPLEWVRRRRLWLLNR